MADRNPRIPPQIDDDGVRTIEFSGVRKSIWLLALAIVIAGLAVFVVVGPWLGQALNPPTDARAAGPNGKPPVLRSTAVPMKVAAAPTPARIAADHTNDPSARSERKEPTAAAAPPTGAPSEPRAAGSEPDPKTTPQEPAGIALFPPPGTKPIKQGLVVPEDFELPPGYVRHYQTTDDGYQLPAILMFHPDYNPVDERGEPIPLPEDRVVPAEMAPPGMPARILDVPEAGATPDALSDRPQRAHPQH
ncbi:MAG: hypothetical protein HYR72_14275 [Deltaproteobacteria bacterium]|nr:hypothetical protein [Deltaproteobacteria bacterium]MBI3391510.1 hypothetical protein [Deltaproteobacteria bacterium]